MLHNVLILAAGADGSHGGHGHVVNELPIPPIWYGIIMFVLLLSALFAIMSMRSVGLRQPEPTTAVQHHGTGTPGHGSHSAGH